MARARTKAGGPRRGRFRIKKLGKGFQTHQKRFKKQIVKHGK